VTLYYVVKVGAEWAVMDMTGEKMKQRLKDEPGLLKNLDIAPFRDRLKAEKRRDLLNKELKEN